MRQYMDELKDQCYRDTKYTPGLSSALDVRDWMQLHTSEMRTAREEIFIGIPTPRSLKAWHKWLLPAASRPKTSLEKFQEFFRA